ncbi:triadin-like isoform X2 [Anguilla rostrata]|uniref:triadin-like isoform X2 n=1 Tax=Anguilla rostrata TaxID=7938 RepID=UPI0030CBFF14
MPVYCPAPPGWYGSEVPIVTIQPTPAMQDTKAPKEKVKVITSKKEAEVSKEKTKQASVKKVPLLEATKDKLEPGAIKKEAVVSKEETKQAPVKKVPVLEALEEELKPAAIKKEPEVAKEKVMTAPVKEEPGASEEQPEPTAIKKENETAEKKEDKITEAKPPSADGKAKITHAPKILQRVKSHRAKPKTTADAGKPAEADKSADKDTQENDLKPPAPGNNVTASMDAEKKGPGKKMPYMQCVLVRGKKGQLPFSAFPIIPPVSPGERPPMMDSKPRPPGN